MTAIIQSEANTWAYLRDIAFEEVIPIGFHVDVTYRCDLSCSHCYLEDRKRRELTVEEYREFFADLAGLGGLYLLISGGDVFVRPDALDILWAAAEHRFDMSMITHAMSIDDARADELKAMGMRRVNVSVYHANPHIHDRVTKRRGSFERTLEGIRRLLDRGIEVNMKCPIFAVNEGAERVMPALAAALGAEVEMGAQIRGGNDGTDELLSLNMNLDSKANVYDCFYAKETTFETMPRWGSQDRTCLAGHASGYLTPGGDVQPCLDYEESAGNIRDKPFAELWKTSPLLNRLRGIRRDSFTGCQSCGNVSFCALCPALAARETGDPTGSAPSKCRESTAIRYVFERREAEKMASELDLMAMFGLGG